MNVFRLNFSHGTHDEHEETFATVRRVSEKLGLPIGVLGDLCGPKIRAGHFEGGEIELEYPISKNAVVFAHWEPIYSTKGGEGWGKGFQHHVGTGVSFSF